MHPDTTDRSVHPGARCLWGVTALALLMASASALADDPPGPDDPPAPMIGVAQEAPAEVETVELSPVVVRLLDDELLDEADRRRLALFHGQFDRVPDPSLEEQARIALARYDLEHPSLDHADAPILTRAKAAMLRGEADEVVSLLDGQDDPRAQLLAAQARLAAGQTAAATAVFRDLRERLLAGGDEEPDHRLATVEAMLILAELEGRPGDYHRALRELAHIRNSLDRLYWPAFVVEARLMASKEKPAEAIDAALQGLALNPAAGEALEVIGVVSAQFFRFEAAESSLQALRGIHPDHLLADLLEAELRLSQQDARAALAVIGPALERFPSQRRLLALRATAEALSHREQAFSQALAAFDQAAPGHPLAYAMAGRFLSRARQYPRAETVLREAIRRQPNAALPHVELGLLLMQAGDEQGALEALRTAVRVDPFHVRAANQLALAQELTNFETIETEHFIIRYRQGVDEALARDMPLILEQIYRDVTGVFDYRPANPTLIEILPDERYFGVRITGVPEIWTIAACTGDVIAMTPPSSGARQRGDFDWARVIRHEYVHTVTLNQTAFRIPHWFTEAAAVHEERAPRDWSTWLMLAEAWHEDALFDLVSINWAFVRPRTPRDRPLAYAQASWMYEFITEQYGHQTILDLMVRFRSGTPGVDGVTEVTGLDHESFIREFRGWAGDQLVTQGLGPREPLDVELDELSLDDLDELLKRHPDDPILRKAVGQRLLANFEPGDETAALDAAISAYARLRPADPWSSEARVEMARISGVVTEKTVAALVALDQVSQASGAWARQLARLYRVRGEPERALHFAERTLLREPYNVNDRELAATLALQAGDMNRTLHHIRAMAILEPTYARHQVRLAALHHRLGDRDASQEAARTALTLDPEAPVARFLAPKDD